MCVCGCCYLHYRLLNLTISLTVCFFFSHWLAGGSDSSVGKRLFLSVMMGDREACLFVPVASAGTWLKHFLSTPKHSLEEASHSDHWSSHPFYTRKRLVVVALLVILALVVMLLLLLLNYYCIVVWRLCQEEEFVAPIFQNTSPELEKQDWEVTCFLVFVLVFGAFMHCVVVLFVWGTDVTVSSVRIVCALRKLLTHSGYLVPEFLVLYLFKWHPEVCHYMILKIMPIKMCQVSVFIHLFKMVNLYQVALEM